MIRKVEDKDNHAIRILQNGALGGELVLVKGGSRAYLWIKPLQGVFCTKGASEIRKLAKAILEEFGE